MPKLDLLADFFCNEINRRIDSFPDFFHKYSRIPKWLKTCHGEITILSQFHNIKKTSLEELLFHPLNAVSQDTTDQKREEEASSL